MTELLNREQRIYKIPRTGRNLNTILDTHMLSLTAFEGQTVLDLGCGRSKLGDELEDIGIDAKVFGFDFNPENAEDRNTSEKGARFVLAHLDALPVLDDSADIVLATYSLPIWAVSSDEIRGFFSECDRVLKPGGILSVYPIHPNVTHSSFHAGREPFNSRQQTILDIQNDMFSSGRWLPNFGDTSLLSARKLA